MASTDSAKSYTTYSGWRTLFRQAGYLRRVHAVDLPNKVRRSIADTREVEDRVRRYYSLEIRDLDVLEIGPGQYLSQLKYFARSNRIVGIDLDVIAYKSSLALYAKMLRLNGIQRTVKTLVRKACGIDATYRSLLNRELGIERESTYRVLQMDASKMMFEDEAFDFIYSRAVFHHLRAPHVAVAEVVRTLRPGGVAYIALHPYTNPTGFMDPSAFPDTPRLGLWPHLRAETRDLLRPNAFVNGLTIPDWQACFSGLMPGCSFIASRCEQRFVNEATAMHSRGELTDHAVEDLTTGEWAVLWRKPIEERSCAHGHGMSLVASTE